MENGEKEAIKENTQTIKNAERIKSELELSKNQITAEHTKKLLKDLTNAREPIQIIIAEAMIGLMRNNKVVSKDIIQVLLLSPILHIFRPISKSMRN